LAALESRCFSVKTTYSVSEAQTNLPALLRRAESGRVAAIRRHSKTVAYVVGAEEFGVMVETMEILANPKAMKAIRAAEAGRGKYLPAEQLAE
jgi:prevent-host-death family protein